MPAQSPASPIQALASVAADPPDATSPETSTTPPAAAAARPAGRFQFTARAFLLDKHYSHGIAVRRAAPDTSKPGSCGAEELIVANGHDHSPQFTAVVSLFSGSCQPVSHPKLWSATALHFADVAAADLYGDGADEVVMASLAGRPGQKLDSGQVLRLEHPGDPSEPETELDSGYGASSLAIGDLDEDGDLDLLVGSFWAPKTKMKPELELKTDEVTVPRTITVKQCGAVAKSSTPLRNVPLRPIELDGGGSSIFGFPFGAAPSKDEEETADHKAHDDKLREVLRNATVKKFPLADGEVPPGFGHEPVGPVFVYLQTRPGKFEPHRWIASPGAVDLLLADIDGDGHLDLVTGGRDVRVIYGPLVGNKPSLTAHKLPWSGTNPGKLLVHSVDVAFIDAGEGRKEVLIAANEGCYKPGECKALCGPGVSIWTAPRTGAPPVGWKQFFRPTQGLATALSFSSLDGDTRPDLLVGRMLDSDTTRCASYRMLTSDTTGSTCEPRPGPVQGCVGAPLIAFLGSEDGATGWLNKQADSVDITRNGESLSPMSFRILPYAHQELRDAATTHTETHTMVGTAATFTGAGHVINVAAVKTAAGEPLEFRHSHGERHITLAAPHQGEVTVDWRIVEAPGFLVTSVSPLGDATGPSFFAKPIQTNKTGG